MESFLIYFVVLILSYVIGSMPFGLWLTFWKEGIDVRTIGSNNIGATNVLRTGNKKLAAAVLALDMSKSVVAVFIGWLFLKGGHEALAGLAAVLGHMYPVFLRFKGGKGVASAMGMYLAVNFSLGAMLAFVWIAVAVLTKYSSAAALVTFILAPALAIFFGEPELILPAGILTLFILYKHRPNIIRLLNGEESKINLKSKLKT